MTSPPNPLSGAERGSSRVGADWLPSLRRRGVEGEVSLRRLARLLWAWLPVLAWMGMILVLSSQSDLPARTNPQTGETVRVTFTAAKLAHIVEYSVLGLLLLRALAGADGGIRLTLGPAMMLAVVLAGAFGAVDELQQSFVPRREPRVSDIAIDTVSAFLAVMLAAGWLRFRG